LLNASEWNNSRTAVTTHDPTESTALEDKDAIEHISMPSDFTREVERSTNCRLCRFSSATVRLNHGALIQWPSDRLQPKQTVAMIDVNSSANAATDATGLFLANMKPIQR